MSSSRILGTASWKREVAFKRWKLFFLTCKPPESMCTSIDWLVISYSLPSVFCLMAALPSRGANQINFVVFNKEAL